MKGWAVLFLVASSILGLSHAWLAGEWLGNDPFQRTRQRPELSWQLKFPRIGDGPSPGSSSSLRASLEAALATYNYTLPLSQLQRSLAYVGSATRLRRVLDAAARPGASIKVAAIGGSISWGQGASKRGETDWFSVFSRWLISAFPTATVHARNGCTPGVPTPYMIMCLEASVDTDVDLVFVEFTLNDAHSMGMAGLTSEGLLYGNRIVKDTERLVRRILALPNRPAVVLLHTPPVGMANYPRGHPKNPLNRAYRPFYMTSEDAQGALSQYYDLQYLSLRTALYRLAVHRRAPGFLWEDLFVDHHPGDHGHKVMADLAVYLVHRTILDLLMAPYGKDDEEILDEQLPGPMYPGNEPPDSPMCRVGEGFRSLVSKAAGFKYVNEGTAEKPKPGFVATRPGAALRLTLDTDRSSTAAAAHPHRHPNSSTASGGANGGGGGGGGELLHVYLLHLRSYTDMGVARFSCVSGCACADVEVDAHHTDRVSQVYLAGLEVTQAGECVLEVKVLKKTSSGGNKFKISGVVVAERPGAQQDAVAQMGTGHGKRFGLAAHADEEQGVEQVTLSTAQGVR